MQGRKIVVGVLSVIAMGLPSVVKGQGSSINAFSPYTFYGIGDLSIQGPANIRSMGGAGIGYRSSFNINYMNPASYSSIGQKSAIFNFGLEGQNFYAKTASAKNLHNTFNVRDVALSLPLARRLGTTVSITPFSSVGYRVQGIDQSQDVGATIGQVKYVYEGSGGVTQFKWGVGYELFRNVSIGAEAVYYHGNIERAYGTSITQVTGSGTLSSVSGQKDEEINRVMANFGIQANLIYNPKTILTVGAVYNMGGRMNGKVTNYLPSNNYNGDTVLYKHYTSNFRLPDTYGVGFFLHRAKFSIGADYAFSNWGEVNSADKTEEVDFRNTHTIRFGGQFTPNPGDVRNLLKRWTYRAGFRYSNYYMVLKGQKINEGALTFGIGIPLGMTARNSLDLGLELGRRGNINNGMIRENFVKFSVGLSLFGEDYWFVKPKYD